MPKIVVLGSGIAGISAGYHAQQKGYECEIYENMTGKFIVNMENILAVNTKQSLSR